MQRLDKTNLLLTIVLLILVMINISIFNNKILAPTMNNQEVIKQYEKNIAEEKALEEAEKSKNTEMSQEDIEKEQLINLKSMGEADRMYTYFGKYITLIESGKYEEAYNLLYEDFKEQYFQTLEAFKTYVTDRYPQFISVQYDSIERQGEYYILTVVIRDSIPKADIVTLQQKFVIHEKGFNDFELSFQVI